MKKQILTAAVLMFASVTSFAQQISTSCRVHLEYDNSDFKCVKWKQTKIEILATLRAKGYEPVEGDEYALYNLRLQRWSTPKADRQEPQSLAQATLSTRVTGHELNLSGRNSQEEYRIGTDDSAISLLAQSVASLPTCEESEQIASQEAVGQVGPRLGAQDWIDASHD